MSQQGLAGHIGRAHATPGSKAGLLRGAKQSFKCRTCGRVFGAFQELGTHAAKMHPRDGAAPKRPPPKGGECVCPLCVRPLPPAAKVVVDHFIEDGLDEVQATRLATIAWALLRIA